MCIRDSFFFVLDTTRGLAHMLKVDGLLWNWRVWRDGIRWMWGKEGVFRPLIRTYLDFFKDGFHPWEHNNLDPVSYTHLDVYKRQGYESAGASHGFWARR